MDESRYIPQVYLVKKRLPESRRLLRAAGGSLAVHVALFVLVTALSGERGGTPPPARVISVDIREFDLPAERSRTPEKLSVTRSVRTVAQPAPARTAALPGQVTVSAPPLHAAAPAQNPVTPPAAIPSPAPVTPSSRTSPTAWSVHSVKPASGMPGGSSAAAPASLPLSSPAQAAPPLPVSAVAPSHGRGYLALCRGLIEKNKDYPVMARRGKVEGTVMVSCVIARDGSIRQSGVIRTSGSTLLDTAALRAVRSVGLFPPLPPEFHGNDLSLEVPITFRLAAD